MSPKTKLLSQPNEEAIHLLTRELGVADTARFLRQFTTGTSIRRNVVTALRTLLSTRTGENEGAP